MGANESSEKPAFHVLKVAENSPAAACNIEEYFDYIVAINDTVISEKLLIDETKKNIGTKVKFALYNSKSDTFRECFIIPSIDWGGSGLLGLSVRFCTYHEANTRVWHVLDVLPNSPASKAGLISYTDYIVASEMQTIATNDDLFQMLQDKMRQPITFIVYNSEQGTCRTVVVIPDDTWGGNGCLGCDIGFGALHRIPTEKLTISATAKMDEFVGECLPESEPSSAQTEESSMKANDDNKTGSEESEQPEQNQVESVGDEPADEPKDESLTYSEVVAESNPETSSEPKKKETELIDNIDGLMEQETETIQIK